MSPLNMKEEPIRLPAIVVAILLLLGPPAAAILLGADVRETIATAILSLVASGGVLGVTESRRAFTFSPATQERLAIGSDNLHSLDAADEGPSDAADIASTMGIPGDIETIHYTDLDEVTDAPKGIDG